MKKLIVCAVMVLLVSVAPVQALTVIDSFETGIGAPWQVVTSGGTINAYSSYAGYTPTDGNLFAALTCGQREQWVYMYMPLVGMQAGQTLSFDYFWKPMDILCDEYAAWLGPPDTWYNVYHEFFDLASNQSVPWTTESYTFEEDGDYYLAFAVRNKLTSLLDSVLGVDYITLEDPSLPPPDGPVPEPLTVMGMVMGVGGLAGYFRRRRR